MTKGPSSTGKTILVVEDDHVCCAFYREALQKNGYQLEFVKNGREALERIAQPHQPALILMDIRLPDINGLDLARQMLSKHPNLVIVAQTAYVSLEMEYECRKVGMKGFIAKPVKYDAFMQLVQELCC